MDASVRQRLRQFISASGLTNLADGVAVVVWAWLASLMTREPVLIALMPVALRLPWFLFAIPAGIVTDRVDRRRLIVVMDAVRGSAFLGVTLLLLAIPLQPAPDEGLAQPALFAAVFGLAVVVGFAEVFRDNAAQTMMPALVPKDALEYANGRLWSAFIHPLSPLEREQFISGVGQVVNLALTYGSLYSGGGMAFGGGDSGDLQRALIQELLKKGEPI